MYIYIYIIIYILIKEAIAFFAFLSFAKNWFTVIYIVWSQYEAVRAIFAFYEL